MSDDLDKIKKLVLALGDNSIMRNGCPWCGSDVQNHDSLLTKQAHYTDCEWSRVMEPDAVGRRYRVPVVLRFDEDKK